MMAPKGIGRAKGRIIIGDARKMPEIEDEAVHLVVTSPPYPMIEMWDELFTELNPEIGKALEDRDARSAERACSLMHAELKEVFSECRRILTDGGMLCVNMGDAARTIGGLFRIFPNHAIVLRGLEELGLVTLPYILWKKPTNRPNAFLGSGFLPTNAYVTLDCEHILIARKGGPRKFKPKDPGRYSSSFTKAERDRWFSQIWDDVRGAGQESRLNDARTGAFPAEIPRRLIRMFSVRGDAVVDPFLGTGTTAAVAIENGRDFIGYEIRRSAISREINDMAARGQVSIKTR